MPSVTFVDTHCHLDFPAFDVDRDAVIRQAQEKGVSRMVNVGSSLKGSQDSVRLAEQYEAVFASVGCHPHDAKEFGLQDMQSLRELARSKKVVAIGEIGLDYYRDLSPRDQQRELFASSLRLARELDLPAVIHSRQAQEETLEIMRREKVARAIIHCFSGDGPFLRACLEEGFFISFTCNITYKKADSLRELVKQVPLDRLCLETDAPYLPPEGLRGRRNNPEAVISLAAEIARIRGLSVSDVALATTQNARAFFGLP